jgi:outer membrane receptor protein involved in Fe transport
VLAPNGGETNLETSFYENPGVERESIRLGFNFNYDLTDALTFTSVTGYNNVDSEARLDQTNGGGDVTFPVVGVGSPFFVQGFGAPPTIESRVGFILDERSEFEDFSQEFRLAYDAGKQLRYMAGFYYYTSDSREDQITSFDTQSSTSVGGIPACSPFAFVPPTGCGPATLSISPFYEGAPGVDQGKEELESWSVFGSADFDFNDQLTLGIEMRYNKDKFDFNRAADSTNASGSFDAFLPKFIGRYQATENLLLYANVGKGNKPGGVNSTQGLPAVDQPYDEETAWSYELGFKSLWLDNRLKVNVAAYHIDWEDLQLTTTRSATVMGQARTFSILENLGKASVTGVELDLSYDFTEYWSLSVGYALTDSEIDEFINSVDAGAQAGSAFREAALIFGYDPGGDVVISGTQLPQSSKHQLNLTNTFSGNLTSTWEWFVRGDYRYNSKRFAQVYNLAHTGSREIINLCAGARSDDIDIELWVDNLTNDNTSTALIRYVEANPLTFNPFNRAIGVTLPRGRQIGITGRYRF